VVLNWFWVASEDRQDKDKLAADFGVKVAISAADMTRTERSQPQIDRRDARRMAGSTCRHTAGISITSRRVWTDSGRENAEKRSCRSTCRRRSNHTAGFAGDSTRNKVRAASSPSLRPTGWSHRPFKAGLCRRKHGIVGLTKVAAAGDAEEGIT